MSIKEINPTTWYSERELSFTPTHFVVATTPITVESKLWILDSLQGRFSVMSRVDTNTPFQSMLIMHSLDGVPAFEDPKEAMMYELKWS